ncbi:MAG: hypothetical protein ACLQVW_10080 [Limisphaerales bacterium]
MRLFNIHYSFRLITMLVSLSVPVYSHGVASAAFSPDGSTIVTAGQLAAAHITRQ